MHYKYSAFYLISAIKLEEKYFISSTMHYKWKHSKYKYREQRRELMRYNQKTVLLIFAYRTIFELFTFLVEKFRDRMQLKITLFDKSTVCGTTLGHVLRSFQKSCEQSVKGKAPP